MPAQHIFCRFATFDEDMGVPVETALARPPYVPAKTVLARPPDCIVVVDMHDCKKSCLNKFNLLTSLIKIL